MSIYAEARVNCVPAVVEGVISGRGGVLAANMSMSQIMQCLV